MKRSQSLFTNVLFVLSLIAASFAVLAFAAAPVANAETIVYDFTPTLDGNGNPIPDSGLQGWTVVFPTSGNLWANYGEWGWMPDDGHLGAGWEDADTELGRSPEFILDGTGPLTFTLFGSASPIATPVAPSKIPEIAIVDGGFMGVALRDIAADAYVLSARLPANNYETWTTLSFSADDLLPYVIPGAKYTLDFVDYNKFSPNGDGWQIMGEVSIPGVLVLDPIWNGGAGTAGPKDGPGTWNTDPGNTIWFIWFDVAAPMAWTDGNPAVFGAGAGNGAAGDVEVEGTVKPTSIRFNTTGDGGAYRLTQGIDGLIDLDGKVVKVTANVDAEIQTTIANGGLNKLGGGTLTLSGENTYDGATTIGAGTLNLANSLALQNSTLDYADAGGSIAFDAAITEATFGGLSGTKNLLLENASYEPVALTVGQNNTDTEYYGNLSGGGSLIKVGTGTLRLNTNDYDGNTTLVDGILRFRADSLGTGKIVFEGGTLQYRGHDTDVSDRIDPIAIGQTAKIDTSGNDVSFGTAISGEGGLSKLGDGTLTLSVANTYEGDTTISGGNLQIAALDGLGGGNITFLGGTLQYGPGSSFDVSGRINDVAGDQAARIDTNGNDVQFDTAITGDGVLTKLGDGALTLGAAIPTGPTTVSGGALNIGSATGTVATLNVPAGGTANLGLNAAVTQLNVTGGTVNTTGTGVTVNTATLSGGTVNASTNTLAITGTLTDSRKNQFVWTPGAGSAFLASGDNLRDPGVARTLTLTGGMLTLSSVAGLTVTDGLTAWFDASQLSYGNDETVTTWADLSGNSHTATTAAGMPVMATDQVNGLPAVQFRGASLNAAGTLFAKEHYYVFRSAPENATWSNYGAVFGHQNDARESGYLFGNDATNFWGDQFPDAVSKNGTPLSGDFDMGTINEYMVLKIDVNNGNTSPVDYQIGGQDNNWLANMDIAEIITYDRMLTSEEEAAVGGYLTGKYNIATTYEPMGKAGDFSTTGIAVTANSELALPATDCTLGTVTLVGGSELTLSGATKVSVSGLTGNGSVVGTVIIPAGGVVSPGASIGAITVSGLTLDAGSLLTFEIASTSSLDQVIVTEAGGLTINGGAFTLLEDGTSNAFADAGTYNLIGYNTSFVGDISNLAVVNTVQDRRYNFGAAGGFITLDIVETGFWNGGGGADANWNNAANWNDIAPQPGDVLSFRTAGGPSTTLNNNLDNGRSYASLRFDVGAPAFTLDGNSIKLAGEGIGDKVLMVNNSTNIQTVSLDVELGDNGKIDANSAAIVVGGNISGDYSLTKTGAYTLTLSGDNSYTGGTIIKAGNVVLGSSTALGTGGNLTLGGGALDLGTTTHTVGAVSVTAAAPSGDTIGNGGLIANSYDVSTADDVAISADLGGSGGLNKSGGGILTLTGNNTYAGATSISEGTLQMNGSLTGDGGPVTVPSGTTLGVGASGNIARDVAVSGGNMNLAGTLAAGTTLTVTSGTVNVAAGGTVATATLKGGTVNAGTNALAITDTLEDSKKNKFTWTPGAGDAFLASGNNVGNADVARTLTLTGGTLTLVAPPAGPAEGSSLWLNANDTSKMTFSSGNAITAWASSSGTEGTVTGNGSYTPDVINGHAVVRFTNSEYMSNNVDLSSSACTIFAVERFYDGDNHNRIISAVNNNWLFGAWGGELDRFYFEGWMTESGITADTNPHMYEATIGGSGQNSTVYVYDSRNLESVQQIASNQNGTQGPNGLGLNNGYGGGGGGERSNADVAEVLIYNGVLTAEQRAQTEAYLIAKYWGDGSGGIGSSSNFSTTGIAVTANSELALPATDCTLGTVTLVGNSQLILSGATKVSVSGLTGNGSVVGTVTIPEGGMVSPGASIGTITVSGLTLDSGSFLTFEIADEDNLDQVIVTGTDGLTINGGGIFLFEDDGATPFSTFDVAYSLIRYNTSFVGDLSNLYVENKIPDTQYRFNANGSFITLTLAVAGYWNGGGTDPNWSTVANWNDIAPVDGDVLMFRAEGSVGVALNNDLDNGRSFASLQFDDGAPAFTLDGNSIKLTGEGGQKVIMVNNSANVQTVNMDVELKANGKIDANSAAIAVGGDISGGYSLTKIGGSQLTLSGDNSYTGGTIINAGNVLLGSSTALAGGNLTLGGGSLDLGSATHTVGDVSVTAAAATGDTIGNGSLTANSYAVSAPGDVAISADLGGGSAGLAKSGAGTLTLSGANTYTGLTDISAGTLKLGSAGALPNGDVKVDGKLDLNDNSPTIKALNGKGTITTSGSSAVALTVGDGDSDGTFSGEILDGVPAFTRFTYRQFRSWVPLGTLPEGSILRSVSEDVVFAWSDFTGGDWVSDLSTYITPLATPPSAGDPALVQIGGYDQLGDGGTVYLGWNAVGNPGIGDIGATVNDTHSDSDWNGTTGDIDLNTAGLYLTTGGWGADGWTGTVSVTYDTEAGPGAGSSTYNLGTGTPDGVVSLVKVGAGTLTLSGANNYSGGTTVEAGTLIVGNQNALGSGTLTMAGGTAFHTISFEGNGAGGALPNDMILSGDPEADGRVTVDVSFANKDIWLSRSVSGPGGFFVTGSDQRYPGLMLSGAKSFEGGVTLGNGARVTIDNVASLGTGTLRADNGTARLRIAGDVNDGDGVVNNVVIAEGASLYLEVNDGLNATFSGQVSDEGAGGNLIKDSAGALTLAGSGNSIGGSLTVSAGSLTVAGSGMTVGTANFPGPTVNVINSLTVNTSAQLGGLGVSSDTPFILKGSDVVNPTYESHRTITAQGGTMTISAPPPGTGIVIGGGSGSAAFDSGTGVWTLTGTDLNDTGNGFFQYIEVPGGDFNVTVKGTKLVGDSDWNKFGIMARDSLAQNATWCSITDTDGADTSFDGGTNGGKDYEIRPHGEANSAQWIRLQGERLEVGIRVSAYYSFDGVDYTLMTTTDGGQPTPPIDMPSWGATTYLGLTLAAWSQTTRFENVTIAFPALTQLDLSTTNIVATADTALVLPVATKLGNVSLKGGSLSADQDITMAADFIYQWELDSTAHSVAITGSLAFESTAWDLAIVDTGGTPLPGVKYDLFSYTGGVSGYSAPEIIALPAGWLEPSFTQDGTHIYMMFGLMGDANGDLVVDAADYIIVKQNFGMTGAEWKDGNFTGADGTVDWDDLQVLMASFGTRSIGGAPATPEPATLGLLAIGALALLRRRRLAA